MSTRPAPPPQRFNFAAHLIATNAHRAAKLAYADDLRTLSYGELAERVRRFAALLAALGIRRDERILLVMLDTVDLPVAFLGALYAGVVPVVANTLLPAGDYAYMLEHSNARALFVSDALEGKLRAAGDDFAAIPMLVSRPGSPSPTADAFEPRLLATTPAALPTDTFADDLAFWLYSSGSTGKPKAAVHTHANLYWTAELYAKPVLGIREDDVIFSAAKLFFAYGLGNSLSFPLSAGATTILMAERATPDAIFRRLTEKKPTIFCSSPTSFVALLASPALPARSEVALRVCTSAGESLPASVGDRFSAHFGCEILDGLGSTEMLHIYLSNRPGEVIYGTTGVPVEGYELDLRDDQGRSVPAGELGELWVRGPSAAVMYWRDRARSQATFHGEWMKTGDKYLRREDGRYVYGGRSDDMLKVSGQYVAPAEVEAALIAHESVLEAAVVGRSDENGLLRTCAYVVLREGHAGGEALANALKAFVKARLAPHKYPRDVVFLAELPKTATGKIQRFKLRALP